MSIQIDSLDVIKQLKENDIIFHPITNESYCIDQICDDYFILTQENERRALRIIYFSRLISEKWEIVKSNIQTETLS